MDVHHPKNGTYRYWSIAIYIYTCAKFLVQQSKSLFWMAELCKISKWWMLIGDFMLNPHCSIHHVWRYYGKSPFLIGKSSLNRPFSIPMLNCQMSGRLRGLVHQGFAEKTRSENYHLTKKQSFGGGLDVAQIVNHIKSCWIHILFEIHHLWWLPQLPSVYLTVCHGKIHHL